MTWLQRRPSGQYRVRLVIPPRLRSFFNGQTILTRILGTADPQAAKRKAVPVVAALQRQLAEAEAALTNPAVAAYRAVQSVQASNLDEAQDEALDSYLTSRMEEGHPDIATYRAVLNRPRAGSEDNPPLSILFARWERETRPTPKTAFEWRKIRERFTALALGGADFTVRQIERTHVLAYKDALLSMDRSPATISKALAALKSVFAFGVNNGLLVVNPAAGVRVSRRTRGERTRLPYTMAE